MTTDVTLNISRTNSPNWFEATDVKKGGNPSTRKYYYLYTGGNTADNNGNISTTTGTPITFTVTLDYSLDSTYIISKVNYSGNDNNECSDVIASDGQSVVITDQSLKNDMTDYELRIEDTGNPNGKAKFTCDPKIINNPPTL